MNKDPDDILIRNMLETVNTPYYDVSRKVLKRIHTVPQKKMLLNRMMVAAATLCVVIAFLGTVKLIRSQFSFDEYAPEKSQFITGEGVWNGGMPEKEGENQPEFLILRGIFRGNDGLGTIFPALS